MCYTASDYFFLKTDRPPPFSLHGYSSDRHPCHADAGWLGFWASSSTPKITGEYPHVSLSKLGDGYRSIHKFQFAIGSPTPVTELINRLHRCGIEVPLWTPAQPIPHTNEVVRIYSQNYPQRSAHI
jgi:hypothetical protein